MISRYARETKEKRGTKIRKLICEGDAVRVSASYQWATVFLISNVHALEYETIGHTIS